MESTTSKQVSLSNDPIFEALVSQLGEAEVSEDTIATDTEKDTSKRMTTEMEASILTPEEAVHRDRAPLPFIFSVKPPAEHRDQLKAFFELLGMSAILRLFTARNTVLIQEARKADGPYSLSRPEEFSSALAEGVNATMTTLTESLANLYTAFSNRTQTEDQLLERSQIHGFVLPRLFKAVPNLEKNQMGRLDKLLTRYTRLLKPYKIAPDPKLSTLKFCIILQYVKAIDITGTGDAFIVEPCTRVVNISVKAEEWTRALTKPGFFRKHEKIGFSMTTTTIDYTLDSSKYQKMRAKFTAALKSYCSDIPEIKEALEKHGIEGFGLRTSILLNDKNADDDGDDGGHGGDKEGKDPDHKRPGDEGSEDKDPKERDPGGKD